MSEHGSNDSLYKSASSSEGDLENEERDNFSDPLQRPNFLSGTSESSLIQVNYKLLRLSWLLKFLFGWTFWFCKFSTFNFINYQHFFSHYLIKLTFSTISTLCYTFSTSSILFQLLAHFPMLSRCLAQFHTIHYVQKCQSLIFWAHKMFISKNKTYHFKP